MKKSTAMIFCFGSILCWAVSPVLIRYVKDFFSVSFQNFFRFGVSIIILWIFTMLTVGRTQIITALRSVTAPVPKLLAVAGCIFTHQFFLLKGVYLLLPGIVTIVEESTIIFAAALAFIFLPAERSLIRQPRFIAGIIIAVGGVVLTVLPELRAGEGGAPASVIGLLSVFISSSAWALFSLLIKLWLPDTPSAVTSSAVFTLVIPFFLVNLAAGGGTGLLQPGIPFSAWILLSVSGIIGIGAGYSFYYQALKGLGVTLTSSLSLLIPVFTACISFVIFGETLSPLQLAGSAVLLAGCFIVARTRFSL